MYLMIAALGINTCVPNFCIQLWGGAVRPFPSDWAKAVIRIGNIAIPRADILAAVLSVIMLILLWCFLYKTKPVWESGPAPLTPTRRDLWGLM